MEKNQWSRKWETIITRNYQNGLRIINIRKGRSDTDELICDKYMIEVAVVA